MKRDIAYTVFRRYSDHERLALTDVSGLPVERYRFFGWSENKHAIKLLLGQRSRDKYVVRKVDRDEIDNMSENSSINNLRIEPIMLRSNKLKRDIPFMTTAEERDGFEAKIQKLFAEACVLSSSIRPDKDIDISYMVMCLINLHPMYTAALEYIGYRNSEIGCMCDAVIDDDEEWERYGSAGYDRNYIARVITISLESVIKVLLHDM